MSANSCKQCFIVLWGDAEGTLLARYPLVPQSATQDQCKPISAVPITTFRFGIVHHGNFREREYIGIICGSHVPDTDAAHSPSSRTANTTIWSLNQEDIWKLSSLLAAPAPVPESRETRGSVGCREGHVLRRLVTQGSLQDLKVR